MERKFDHKFEGTLWSRLNEEQQQKALDFVLEQFIEADVETSTIIDLKIKQLGARL